MKSEAALIIGLIMAVLTMFNIALSPEQYAALEYVIQAFILVGGIAWIRSRVFSQETHRKELIEAQEARHNPDDEDIHGPGVVRF